LTYAFANYTTYKPAQATFMTNRYTFEYFRGKVRIVVSSLSSSSVVPRLVFPTNTNPAQTADYGSQNNGFATRMLLNNPTPQCTTLGYMLGLTSGVSAATKNFVYKDHQEPRFGFFANTEPRFLFEARLAPGMYSVQDLTTYLPIAMNPLNFEAPSSTSSVATATGSCYFAFQDSRGLESLIIINSGQYTPETFCQALEHALNRMDSQGAYYSAYANRFAYNNVSLNYDPDTQWQVLEIPAAVVYNVVYALSTPVKQTFCPRHAVRPRLDFYFPHQAQQGSLYKSRTLRRSAQRRTSTALLECLAWTRKTILESRPTLPSLLRLCRA
jgi:hypothetical protein